MVDTKALSKAIKDFEYWSKPSSGDGNTPATVDDINKLIKNTAAVLRTFVSELESSD